MKGLARFAGPVSSAALVVGVLLLLAGGGYWLVQRDFDLTLRLILAAGILGIAIFVALRPEAPQRTRGRQHTGRTLLYGGNAVVMSVAVLAILGFVNYFGNINPQRWDLTANQQNTLSPESIQVVDAIKQPVKITGFFQTEDYQRRQNVQDLLRQYQARNPLITYEFIDPDQNPAVANAYDIRIFGTLVFESNGKKQTTTGSTEQDITSTLLRLTSNKVPKVLFLTGHGERDLNGADRDSYSQVKTVLQNDNIDVGTINFSTSVTPTAQLAQEIDLLVIAAPQRDLLPEDLDQVNAYIDNGGKLMVMVEPSAQPLQSVQQILNRYQITQRPGWVIDPAAALRQDPGAFYAQSYQSSPATDKLAGIPTIYPSIAALEAPTSTPGLRLRGLFQSSDRSWLDTDARQPNPEGKPRGPFTLGYIVEPQTDAAASATPNPNAPKGRAVVIGDSDFATNQWIQALGNRDMLANLVSWGAGSEAGITIRAKPFQSRTMFLSQTQQNLIFFSSVLFLPLAVLLLGGWMWWRRR